MMAQSWPLHRARVRVPVALRLADTPSFPSFRSTPTQPCITRRSQRPFCSSSDSLYP